MDTEPSARGTGRTTRALEKALFLTEAGAVTFYCANFRETFRLRDQLHEMIGKGFVANPWGVRNTRTGHSITLTEIKKYPQMGVRSYEVVDHFAAEVESSRIDAEIRALERRKEEIQSDVLQ